MNTYTPTPENNSARPRLASVTLPPLPFPIPDDDTRIITSAARVPVLSGKAGDVRWPVLLSGGLFLSKCSVSEWDEVGV